MSNDIQQQTTVNIQEKANLIWAIADKLVGVYKPHEYGNVILPMCVIKRFEDTLTPTKQAVLDTNAKLDKDGIVVKKGFLESAAGQQFYNLSPFTFQSLLNDPENIKDNFESYLNHFSENVIDIIHRMDFDRELQKMADNNVLYLVIKEFCTQKAYLGADQVTSVDMGYIFEELVRKFSESYDEQAGAHFTARDIIYLMAELLVGDNEEQLEREGITASIYDMAMGTSQMLGCLTERFLKIDPEAEITSYGQELNNQTFAIAKADTLIKGGNADNMRQGDTLGDDKFSGYKFDYIISNPPFGIEWKTSKKAVEDEHIMGEAGRFAPGLPAIGDGQMLFLLNGIAKLKEEEGRMAIIQNGSSLFKGDAGSGESEIRGYLLENDWLEAIVQLPNDLFYNTGIATYIWIVTKNKSEERQGKVQLIDASQCSDKRRKSLGNKRVEISDRCRELIMEAFKDFTDWSYQSEDETLKVESKVLDNDYFKYSKLTVERPLRQIVEVNDENLSKLYDYLVHHDVFDTEEGVPEHKVMEYALNNPDVRTVKVAKSSTQVVADEAMKVFYNVMCKLKRNEYYANVVEFENMFNKHPENNMGRYSKFSCFKILHYLFVKTDSRGDIVYDKKGNPTPDSSLRDTEIVPWTEDIQEYMQKNVLPYAPDAWIDEKKTKVGYEIPFTREFYRYVAPRKSEDIFAHLKELEQMESDLMAKILG